MRARNVSRPAPRREYPAGKPRSDGTVDVRIPPRSQWPSFLQPYAPVDRDFVSRWQGEFGNWRKLHRALTKASASRSDGDLTEREWAWLLLIELYGRRRMPLLYSRLYPRFQKVRRNTDFSALAVAVSGEHR